MYISIHIFTVVNSVRSHQRIILSQLKRKNGVVYTNSHPTLYLFANTLVITFVLPLVISIYHWGIGLLNKDL